MQDEEHVLWIDADVRKISKTAIKDLLAYGKDLIVPNCKTILDDNKIIHYDLNSWQDTPETLQYLETLEEDDVIFEGYSRFKTKRKNLNFMSKEG